MSFSGPIGSTDTRKPRLCFPVAPCEGRWSKALLPTGDSAHTLGFSCPHLPWLSGIAKLTAFATSSTIQLNSSCTPPVLTSSNLHTDGGTRLRNVLHMICVLSAHPSSTLATFPFRSSRFASKIFLQKTGWKHFHLKSCIRCTKCISFPKHKIYA